MVSYCPLCSAYAGRALTGEGWLALGDNDVGESVDGLLVEEEVPDFAHELVISWLIQVIGPWLAGRGFVVGSELKLLTAATRGRKPDLVVILPGSKPPPRTGPPREPPDILVEVVTLTPRDERSVDVDALWSELERLADAE